MVARFSVGKSSYGDLRGVEQFVMSARIALQVLSVIADFNAWQRDRGAIGFLSVNEAMRSRVRQSALWANRFILGVAVAPPFTSRHDEVLHGNAIDFGITMPDGSNRALTAEEFAKLHELVEARGGTHTGINFGEQWHHEMATRAELLPPYPNAAEIVANDVNPAPPTPAPAPNPPAPIPSEGSDMRHGQSSKTRTYYDFGELTARGTGRKAHAVANAKATRGIGTLYRRMTPTQVIDLLEDIQTNRVDLGFPRSAQIDKQIANEKAA
ncbi:hypothetical protein E9228_002963 [Curtobacterium flaccumfaciens]|uniref:Peptidase M15B domain-containing protein n=1 Tax=Curtobacterium salicis TaxID=1779862 RepID=A0ABX0TEU4_9MICO|nr:hypothetical protein [Curtobacterium sp. WW7]NII42305.1 hypothetical protein [Curtobacterium sp. WW7]